jgi:hypothetical protein
MSKMNYVLNASMYLLGAYRYDDKEPPFFSNDYSPYELSFSPVSKMRQKNDTARMGFMDTSRN